MSNPSTKGKSVVPLVARNDPLPVILADLPPPVLPAERALSRRRDSSRVITDGRVPRDQSATNADDDAWKSESRRDTASRASARRGLIKKPRLTRERHACTRG